VDGQLQSGAHEFGFNAAGFSSGVYFYRLSTPVITMTKRMILAK